MGRQIEELARFVARTRCEDIPEPVRAHARLVLLDTLGVILAGSERPEVAALRERLAATRRKRRHGLRPRLARAMTRAPRRCSTASPAARSSCARGCGSSPGRRRCRYCRRCSRSASRRGSTGREMLAAFIARLRCRRAARRRVHAAPAGASERPGVVARRGGGRGEIARPRRRRDQPRDAHRHDAAADPELHERGRRRDGAERGRRDERLCRRARARNWRWPGSRRSRTRSRKRSGNWSAAASPADGMLDELGAALGDHPQLFPPLRLLQPDPSGARLPRGGARRIAAARRSRSSGSRSRPTASRR